MTRINKMEKLRFIYIEQTNRLWKSVKSSNQCKSVVQTSYDIVKAHGGELKLETKEGEGSEFIIHLPII